MSEILLEIVILLLLIGMNGVLATAEMAFVAARRGRLQALAGSGHGAAALALRMAETPTRFLSTVQVGITLIGIVAGVFGGTTLARELSPVLERWPWIAPHAGAASLALVVCAITFLSLVFGELLPKRLALGQPERILLLLSRPMHALSVCVAPVAALLTGTTDAALRWMGMGKAQEPVVSDEEVRTLIEQGHHAGVFHPSEIAMVEGVMKLDDREVSELMTPRGRIVWLDATADDEANWRRVVGSGHTYFPVRGAGPDEVLGVVSVKAMWANLAAGAPARLRDLATTPLVVPSSMTAMRLLETFKSSRRRMALVADEFGHVAGLVTVADVLKAIVGELPPEHPGGVSHCRRRPDGSWLVDGGLDFSRLCRTVGLDAAMGEESRYRSVGGFVLERLGRIPVEGDRFDWGGWSFEIVDMDRHRIDKVSVTPVASAMAGPGPEPRGVAG